MTDRRTAATPSPGKDRGHDAASPFAIPKSGWKDVLSRTWAESGHDNIGLIAAGVAFYAFLAIVPLIGALVLTYGLIADPATVVHDVRALTDIMPTDAAKLIGEQLMNVVSTSGSKKGFGLLLALVLAFYGAMNGASAIVTALDIAYEEEETRGFFQLKLLALAITLVAVLLAIVAMVAITALGHLDALLPASSPALVVLGKVVSYLLTAAAGAAAAATLYRYGPDRTRAQWVWLTPGSVAATLIWLLLTIAFGIYVANFGNYDATYGSLGAVVVLLTWIYLSAYVFLMGAELNSELERQTARDTTTGPAKPIGSRGAQVADSVAGAGGTKTADPDADASKPSQPASPPAPATLPPATTLAAIKLGSVAARADRAHRPGKVAGLLAGGGLAAIARRDRAVLGVAMLAVSGWLAWARRERPE